VTRARAAQSAPAVFEALFNVLRTVTNEATVQHALALLDDAVARDHALAKEMHTPSPEHKGAAPPNAPLVLSRLLSRSDWFTQARAARLLSAALAAAPAGSAHGQIVGAFLEWVTGQLRAPAAGDAAVEVATGALGGLLRSRDVRRDFAPHVPLLVRSPLAAPGLPTDGRCAPRRCVTSARCLLPCPGHVTLRGLQRACQRS
jgi:V-ATPase subunit H